MTVVNPKIEALLEALEDHYRAAREAADCEDLPDTHAGRSRADLAAASLAWARSLLEDALVAVLDDALRQ